MDYWLLGIIAFLLLFIVIGLVWRHVLLRRRLDGYARLVRRAADEALPVT